MRDRRHGKVHDNWFLVAAHDYAGGVDLLARYMRRDVDEVTRAGVGDELEPVTPSASERGGGRVAGGARLEFVADAGPGDFIYVPPHVPRQEINASNDEPLICVVVRSDQEPVVVNLAVPPVEHPSLIE